YSQTPTGSNRVIIRGNNSLTGNNQPLYVVDGIPLDNPQGDQNVSVWNSGDDIDYGNPISQLNASDIDNIEILKGPNASALYGSRAANGVILITTKKGTTKKGIGISVNSNTMFTQNSEYPDFQYVYGSGHVFKAANNKNALDKETGLPTPGNFTRAYGAPLLGFDVMGYNREITPYTAYPDNVRDLYQLGTMFTNNFSFDKAWDKSSIRVSYTNTNSEWVIKDMEKQKRHNLSLKAITQMAEKLRFETSILYTNDKVQNRVYQNGSNRNPANNYMYMHPNMTTENLTPYKDESGNAFSFAGPFHNPIWNLYENYNEDQSNRLIGSIGLTYDIIDGLNFRGRIMGDLRFV
ncbi:MAG: TonB-dependent receptor plug domain-containing protein, partial [Cyclobacteriaceae bacterium]|nr:TonB-dependent receptor plug domain-containing protein [Cyclobacteriaceae bacterium]